MKYSKWYSDPRKREVGLVPPGALKHELDHSVAGIGTPV